MGQVERIVFLVADKDRIFVSSNPGSQKKNLSSNTMLHFFIFYRKDLMIELEPLTNLEVENHNRYRIMLIKNVRQSGEEEIT